MNHLFTVAAILISLSVFGQRTVSPAIYLELLGKETNAQLLDVRTPDEYNGGHLKDAQNIDWRGTEFEQKAENLDFNRPVFVYCLSGGRSASAAAKLSKMGFKQVYDLQGGIMAWKNAGNEVTIASSSMGKSGMSKEAFDEATSTDVPVLVDFFAPWCAPCRKMSPMLDELTATYPTGFKLLKLNADQSETMMNEMGVKEIPTFFIFKNGKVVWTHVGLVEKDVLMTELGLN